MNTAFDDHYNPPLALPSASGVGGDFKCWVIRTACGRDLARDENGKPSVYCSRAGAMRRLSGMNGGRIMVAGRLSKALSSLL